MDETTRSRIGLGHFPVLGLIAPELDVHYTMRAGGVSDHPFDSLNLGEGLGDRPGNVRENRRRVLTSLHIPLSRLARADQVHGSRIAVVNRGGLYRGTDGFITKTRGLALAISTADCHPLVIYSPPEKVLAALHVGRRGAKLGIIPRAISLLTTKYRVKIDLAIALLGPGICRRCYPVNARIASGFPETSIHVRDGTPHLDLRRFCIGELIAGGMQRRNIHVSRHCNSCEPEHFFSHRRYAGRTGRHWTLAVMRA